jgi:L-ascorbate metabolism protein UlaG (beta-lactamase superfamily)/rhodanese-related sulfurtransferase
MKYFLIMSLSFLSLIGCKGYSNLTLDAFEAMLNDDKTAQLVDVRTPDEYAEGHLPGAVNIDWYADDFLEKAQSLLELSHPVLVYCRSGKRSAEAASKLGKAGFEVSNLQGGYLAWTEAGKPVSMYEVERFRTVTGEPVAITLIKHACLEIRYKGLSIQVDPVSGLGKPTDYATEFPKADIILVTHEHGDHCDKTAVDALQKDGTKLVTNARSRDILGWGTVMANGDELDLQEDMHLQAVPAYNNTSGHLQFHPKGRDNGFVLTLDGLRIYIAGDTEDIPEMADLKDIDIAFLPVNQPYTMTVEQCVHAAKTIAPKVLIPYHFSQTDISSLPEALPGIEVRLRQMQ